MYIPDLTTALYHVVPFLFFNVAAFFHFREYSDWLARGSLAGFVMIIVILALVLRQGADERQAIDTMHQSQQGAQLGDLSLCVSIHVVDELSEVEQANCISGVAQKKQDPSLCETLPKGSTDWSKKAIAATKSMCYDALAMDMQDPTLCKFVSFMPEVCIKGAQRVSGGKLTLKDIAPDRIPKVTEYYNPGVRLVFHAPDGWKKIQDDWGVNKTDSSIFVGILEFQDPKEPRAHIIITASSHKPATLEKDISDALQRSQKLGFISVLKQGWISIGDQKGYADEFTSHNLGFIEHGRHWDNGYHAIEMTAPDSLWALYDPLFQEALKSYTLKEQQ